MNPIFECVPNVSEGRDGATIAACADAIERSGAYVAHQTSDAHHNRSVFTLFGDAAAIERAAGALAKVCVERIDLRRHEGVHPRIGALDVLPVVPMEGASIDQAAGVARAAARRMWDEAGLPSIFYGHASHDDRQLSDVRRGEFESLADREAAGERPDCGERLFHPAAGAAAVGARGVLIAFNLELTGADLELAKRFAARLRERTGGLRTVRALAFSAGDTVQLSFNLTDPTAVPLRTLIALSRREAERSAATIRACELIGLIPRHALAEAVQQAFD